MADPGLIKHMVDDGFSIEAANDHVDAVSAAIVARLRAGKSVGIDGVGRLTAKRKLVSINTPPHHIGHVVPRLMVKLAKGEVLEEGVPRPDTRHEDAPKPLYRKAR